MPLYYKNAKTYKAKMVYITDMFSPSTIIAAFFVGTKMVYLVERSGASRHVSCRYSYYVFKNFTICVTRSFSFMVNIVFDMRFAGSLTSGYRHNNF